MKKYKFIKILYWVIAALFLLSDIIIAGFFLDTITDEDKFVRSLLPLFMILILTPFFILQPLLLSGIRTFTKYKMRRVSKCCILIGILILSIATALYYWLFLRSTIGLGGNLWQIVSDFLRKVVPVIQNDTDQVNLAGWLAIIVSLVLFAMGKHFIKKADD